MITAKTSRSNKAQPVSPMNESAKPSPQSTPSTRAAKSKEATKTKAAKPAQTKKPPLPRDVSGGRASKKSAAVASSQECREALQDIPFLAELNDDDICDLAALAGVREFVAGTILFFEDDDADAVYFLTGGAIEVFKSDGTGKKLPLVILRDSGVVGEMGLLSRAPRSATARTLTGARLLSIRNEDFYGALEAGNLAAHRLVLGFARVLSQRLHAVNETLFRLYEGDGASARELTQSHQSLLSEF